MQLWLNEYEVVKIYDYEYVFGSEKRGVYTVCSQHHRDDEKDDVLLTLIEDFENGKELFIDVAADDEDADLRKIQDIFVVPCDNLTYKRTSKLHYNLFVTFIFEN